MSDEILKSLSPLKQSEKALQLFVNAKTPQEKEEFAIAYEEGRSQWNNELHYVTEPLEHYAVMVFTQEIGKTHDDQLKKRLASEISLNVRYMDDDQTINNAFCLNAFGVLLNVAKNTENEEIANKIYAEARFLIDEDEDKKILVRDSVGMGNLILDNLNPKIKDQTAQAHLLKGFNHMNRSNLSQGVPEVLSQKALVLMQQHQDTNNEMLNPEWTKDEKTAHWAKHQIKADLMKLASGERYLFS